MHMNTPIWVWLYDFGPHTHPSAWIEHDEEVADLPQAYPQAHTYAFLTEEEALAHPKAMGWKLDHHYILQKTWLQD